MSQALKEAIILTASYYGQTINPAVLDMYVEDLADLPTDRVMAAYRDYRRNPKNTRFPLPAQIRAVVAPEVDPDSAAREIAARICGAVPKFGWCNGQDARAYIGEVGWEIVQRQGGWSYICENLGISIQPSTFQAQVRDQAKSALSFPHASMAHAIGLNPSDRGSGGLVAVGEILKSISGKVGE